MTVDTAALRRRVAELCPRWDPDELSGFLFLEGGYSNDNYRFTYRGERYVLRQPFRPRPFVDRQLEATVYGALRAGTAPELIALDTGSGCMISRWVPGSLLADTGADATTLAAYLRTLHHAIPPVDRVYDPLAQVRAHLECCDAPLAIERAAGASWTPEQAVACHNDLNPWNVIRSPRGPWVTLDWEWAGRNDPLFDLVTLHQGAGLADAALPSMAQDYLGGAATPGRLRRCLVAFWLRETTWAMAEIAAGNDRPEVVEQRRLGLERLTRLIPDA